MSKPSKADIEQMIQYTRPTNRDLVRRDINQAINSSISSLLLKVSLYVYNDGISKELLCLHGTVECQYRGNRYNIPIEIWLQQDHPNVPPLVYVKPTPDMYIAPTSKDVQPDGAVIIPGLRNWRHSQIDLITLLNAISQAFSQSPPVYESSSASRSTSKTSVSLSNAYPSTTTASLPTTYSKVSCRINPIQIADIEQMIQYIQPTNRDLVRRDINQAINSSISSLVLKVAPYVYSNGTSKELLCLHGTVECQYRGNRYCIPIEIWLQQDHPNAPPLVYVKPTSDMYVSSTSKDVQPDGAVIISYLRNWRHPQSDLVTLLNAISQAFSQSPPVYANSSSKPHPTAYPSSNSLSYPSNPTSYPSNPIPYPSSPTLYLTNPTSYPSNPIPYPSNPTSYPSNPTSYPSNSTSYPSSTSNIVSNNINEQNHTHRFSDIAAEPQRMLLPIHGFERMPLVSLEDAVIPLVSLIPDVEQMVWIAKQNCTNPKDGLSPDESASIMLYTMEWEPYEKSFYIMLNTALRAANREELRSWFSYLRLVITAFQKLPSNPRIIYRGVKSDLTDQYRRGDTVVWWGFSSCTSSIETLKNERFLGKSGTRTLFNIECDSAKNIRSHSYYAEEDEVLLLPGRQFEVVGCLDQGNGLQTVQLKETEPKFSLIKLPSL